MFIHKTDGSSVAVDFENGTVSSVKLGEKELIGGKKPLFTVRLRDNEGNPSEFTAFDAAKCEPCENGVKYSGFNADMSVIVTLDGKSSHDWHIAVENNTKMLIEWVIFPDAVFKPLEENGGEGSVVCTYNEGAICNDINRKGGITPPEYPSQGWYWMFPYMLFGQFMCYQAHGNGLYLASHDADRAPKGIDFYKFDDGNNVGMFFRHFPGKNYGEGFSLEYPVVWQGYEGAWQDGVQLYKNWFEENLPSNVKKISENPAIPEWYKDSPLVVTYPVRGIHDMDKMDPNALFPYENALPLIDEISERVNSRLLVLLMHWEGTAPWAPPYVWPPYGGEEMFNSFADKLHERNHVLGVYCSGFGYTAHSNLIESYDNTEKIEKEGLKSAMCVSPAGKVELSRICTGQRSGYDICAYSEKGKNILNEAYLPLFNSKVDYCQILDQNHGGSQYFCYSREHGHPHGPGKWMTENMRGLLDGWNKMGGGKLFGCESASSEPYIGNLLFSDNRFELNWRLGRPLPVYSYIYHEYLRNFMGNQVSCPLTNKKDSMCARLAYSFTAGDCMTLVVTPFGSLMTNWGNHDFSVLPDKDRAVTFAANMQKFYKEKAQKFLYDGKMIKPLETECNYEEYPLDNGKNASIPDVYTSAWEKDGERVQIFANHTLKDVTVKAGERSVTVPALGAAMINI